MGSNHFNMDANPIYLYPKSNCTDYVIHDIYVFSTINLRKILFSKVLLETIIKDCTK